MSEKLQALKKRLLEISDLRHAVSVLEWDQSTYMPPDGVEYRGRQMATLARIIHEKSVDPQLGHLLDDLRDYGEQLPYDSDDSALIRFARREYDRLTRIPSAFVEKFQAHTTHAYHVWVKARAENDFETMRPLLEKNLDYSREFSSFFPYDHIADPLISETEFGDYGMKAEDIRRIFGELREALVPIVQAITAQPLADDSCLLQPFDESEQLAFGLKVAEAFGYDLNRGRMDLTHHPFEIKLSWGDVRITTRVKPNDLSEALFSTLHEAGHALYEMGVSQSLDGTPLNGGTSAGVHESQSRMWENVVGRSRGFWEHYYPQLQAVFPAQLIDVSVDTFYRAINKVHPSLIRTDADEVTYNLHVMIRFDLAMQMLEGKLAVKDLPDAWNARYESDLGITPPNHHDGVLQDIHWNVAHIGGSFQGYTLGNIMSLQFYDSALKAHPHIPDEIAQGKFSTLHQWLKNNIYQHGSKFTANELLERVTGKALTIDPYIVYLKTKFGDLYSL